MDDLIFKAKKHEYVTADGKKLPSVSELTEPLSKCIYGDIDPEVLAIAAMRGTEIHEATVELDTKGMAIISGDLGDYLQAYANFRKEHVVSWFNHYTEEPMRNGDLYAGTIDRFGIVDDKRTLADIKTSSKITGKNLVVYEAQLNLYRMMLEAHEEKVEQLMIIHLKREGTYQLYNIDVDDKLANICIYINQRLKERKRRVKK